MRPSAILLLAALLPGAVAAQATDTVTLRVGDPRVDGRVYRPNIASVILTITKDGNVVRSNRYTNNLVRGRRDGADVLTLESEPAPDATDPAFHAEIVMDARTLGIVHYDARDGSGRSILADVKAAHVRETTRANKAAAATSSDVTLHEPAYLFSFLDAAIGATKLLKLGRTFRLPTYDLSPSAPPTAVWHNYTVIRSDSVKIFDRWAKAWIVAEEEQPVYTKREIWLVDEPPYLPLVVTHYRDGRVQRYESTLLHDHE